MEGRSDTTHLLGHLGELDLLVRDGRSSVRLGALALELVLEHAHGLARVFALQADAPALLRHRLGRHALLLRPEALARALALALARRRRRPCDRPGRAHRRARRHLVKDGERTLRVVRRELVARERREHRPRGRHGPGVVLVLVAAVRAALLVRPLGRRKRVGAGVAEVEIEGGAVIEAAEVLAVKPATKVAVEVVIGAKGVEAEVEVEVAVCAAKVAQIRDDAHGAPALLDGAVLLALATLEADLLAAGRHAEEVLQLGREEAGRREELEGRVVFVGLGQRAGEKGGGGGVEEGEVKAGRREVLGLERT